MPYPNLSSKNTSWCFSSWLLGQERFQKSMNVWEEKTVLFLVRLLCAQSCWVLYSIREWPGRYAFFHQSVLSIKHSAWDRMPAEYCFLKACINIHAARLDRSSWWRVGCSPCLCDYICEAALLVICAKENL